MSTAPNNELITPPVLPIAAAYATPEDLTAVGYTCAAKANMEVWTAFASRPFSPIAASRKTGLLFAWKGIRRIITALAAVPKAPASIGPRDPNALMRNVHATTPQTPPRL